MKQFPYISTSALRKMAMSFGMVAIAVGSFAAFSSANLGREKPRKKLLSNPVSVTPGSFSLSSGYKFRGNQVITNFTTSQYINLNTVVTFQQGRNTFVLPVRKKVSINLGSQNQVKGATVNISL
ncbi:MAG: hypothetical protein EOO09_07480 [Chitinophagaceae bacterium]|nr:MAG: hypothetical protein EOO09_07480 [Chitinophagaceae bacterium]